jgi:glyoxylase-like metal-dependent hydrolase (beta-lactamase superfamily II)
MLKQSKFVFNSFSENTYILWDDESSESAIIDPGCYGDHEKSILSDFIQEKGLIPKYLINTHCHIDHVFGNSYLKTKYNPTFLAPEPDLFLLKNLKQQAMLFGIETEASPMPDDFITEDKNLSLGIEKGEFIFTPGHSPGEYSLYFADSGICVTGDVLFCEGIGRTDLWGGNYDELIRSIKEKLFKLPDKTIILPGHGDISSIGHEKKHNPFLT